MVSSQSARSDHSTNQPMPVLGRQGECRYCSETGGDLISPCLCSGTAKWVHRGCLDKWRSSTTNPRYLTNCRECGFTFQLDLYRVIDAVGEHRRRRFIRRVAAQGVLAFCAVQAIIVALGFIIRAIDVDEALVGFFHFHTSGDDGSGIVKWHKTTYYVAGLLSFFGILGFAGIFYGLMRVCEEVCCRSVRVAQNTTYTTANGCDACECYFCADCLHSCAYSCDRTDSCRPDCDCKCPDTRGNGGGAGILAVIGIIIAILVVLAGIFIAIVALVVAVQRVIQEYAKLQQVRTLALEYRVRDLADPSDLGDANDPNDAETGAPQPMAMQALRPLDPHQQEMQHQINTDIQAIFQGPDPSQALNFRGARSDARSVPLTR